jgi:hypothetical protein
MRRLAGSQPLHAKASLLWLDFASINLMHKYGPFHGHNISSITAYAACLPACLFI